MKDTLIKAIKSRSYISFIYSGLLREAQPAAVGLSRAGNDVLRCYQTVGDHITPGHEWDLCELRKIHDLKILESTFHNDPPGYRRGDKHLLTIYAEL